MRNIKLEQNLDSDEHWPHITTLKVTASPSATPVPEGTTQPDLENIIQSWSDIAVLRVTPATDFYFGFIVADQAQFLNVPIETEGGKFGVHIGDSDITFLVFAKDMQTQIAIELVERVNIDDERYQSLPLY